MRTENISIPALQQMSKTIYMHFQLQHDASKNFVNQAKEAKGLPQGWSIVTAFRICGHMFIEQHTASHQIQKESSQGMRG